jgi:hypothetical protein
MSDTPILDIDNVPAPQQAGLAASLRALLRLDELDAIDDAGTLLALGAGGELSLIDASDIRVAKFASGIAPVEIVSALPSTGNFAGRIVFLTSDTKLYRYDGAAWTATVQAADVVGQIVAGQIANAAITIAKFAAGIAPVEIVTALPGTGNFAGRQAFLTTDGKTYRYDGAAWTAAVAAADVSGQLSNSQIAAIAAAKLTGQIVATQITDGAITTPKLAAGSVDAGALAANSVIAGKIAAGIITATEIAAATITGSKIAAGAITAANIAADTITAGQIAVGAIGASELAAGSVIAGKIAAGSVTATEIAAATITGAKIAAGAITAANIAADTITAGQIAAGAIGASEIAADAISADKLSVGLRSIDVSGIEFSTAGNVLSWTAGTIEYVNDAGALTSAAISSGNVTWTTGKVYVYWAKAATSIATATSYASARTAGNVVLAIYEGGANLNLKVGRTIIDGGKIKTGSIVADRLNITNLSAISASLGAVDISSAIIGSLTVGSFNIAAGAVTDAKTDQTAPGAPGTPTLTPLVADFDLDGKIDAGFLAAWAAPSSGRAAPKYLIEVFRRLGDKGTDGNNISGYTFWTEYTTPNLNKQFEANARYFHKIRITPLSANEVKGTPSAYSTVGVQPGARGVPTAPEHVVVNRIQLGFGVSWNDPVDRDYFSSEVVVSSSPTFDAFFVIHSTQSTDNTIFSPDLGEYYIGVRHINTSKLASGITPAISNILYTASPLSGLFIGNAAIATRHIANNAITAIAQTDNEASTSLSAGTIKNVAQVSGVDLTSVRQVKFDVSFMNDDPSADRRFTARIYRTDMTGTALKSWVGIPLAANGGHFHDTFVYTPSSPGTSEVFILAVVCSIATSVSYRKLSVSLFYK